MIALSIKLLTFPRVMRHKDATTGGAHQAVFPLRLAEEMIAVWSYAGDLLYEPFNGSGSYLIAATRLKRRCFGMPLGPACCDVALQRWLYMTGTTDVSADGVTSGRKEKISPSGG